MAASFELIWAPVAIADLEDIIEYLASRDSVDAAVSVHEKLRQRASSLARHPLRCRVVPELKEQGLLMYRELIVAPYRIFFRVQEKQVTILGVLDGRRDLEEILLKRSLED